MFDQVSIVLHHASSLSLALLYPCSTAQTSQSFSQLSSLQYIFCSYSSLLEDNSYHLKTGSGRGPVLPRTRHALQCGRPPCSFALFSPAPPATCPLRHHCPLCCPLPQYVFIALCVCMCCSLWQKCPLPCLFVRWLNSALKVTFITFTSIEELSALCVSYSGWLSFLFDFGLLKGRTCISYLHFRVISPSLLAHRGLEAQNTWLVKWMASSEFILIFQGISPHICSVKVDSSSSILLLYFVSVDETEIKKIELN